MAAARLLPCAALLAVLMPATAAAAGPGPGRLNTSTLKVYRVTPINVTGLTNMDTADAAGDVYFGLYQLALPVMCASSTGMAEHMGWCVNRKWLSGGNHTMVYRQFEIEARLPFGIYARCNPDPHNGTFSCCNSHVPGCA